MTWRTPRLADQMQPPLQLLLVVIVTVVVTAVEASIMRSASAVLHRSLRARPLLQRSLSSLRTLSTLPSSLSSSLSSNQRRGGDRRGDRRVLPMLLGTCLLVSSSAALAEEGPVERLRRDYAPAPYAIEEVDLRFDLRPRGTLVTSVMQVKPRDSGAAACADLVLDGEHMELVSLKINGVLLNSSDYTVTKDKLIIPGNLLPPQKCSVETVVRINPDENTALNGLYESSGMLCTQCEAEGFRKITYYYDRPDNMAKFKVRLEGDKAKYPVLLSNGNKIASGNLPGGRHYAVWEDPFPKPSYLFALVAGDLGMIRDEYTTTSGRKVRLGLYSEHGDVDKLSWAMRSLKQAMKWDEDTFGLECDLDNYNVVAVSDFNMGAMENKGLNIFNSQFVLAKPTTATDVDYERILGVIGHEYFHNWTGNRVTCRDWFQLTLKEGLTVFRDQSFSSDMTSHAVKRIEDVKLVRSRQFQEDSGPMAHPIRPESYISMDNFYTITVYYKGAEIIRMYHTLLGKEGFRKGMDLYFQRHDGSAVTCDDFRAAMADANGVDLTQFERWYLQAGTPTLTVEQHYDERKRTFSLKLKQSIPSTPGQVVKLPMHIPVTVGLLGPDGKEMLPSTVLELRDAEQTFVFRDVPAKPVASVLRDFSAPVKLVFEQTDEELSFLMAHDTDSFNRWDAGQKLSERVLHNLMRKSEDELNATALPSHYIAAYRRLLQSAASTDPSLIAYALQLPDSATLAANMDVVDTDRIHAAQKHVKKALARTLKLQLVELYNRLSVDRAFSASAEEVGRRRLRNTCLDFLSALDEQESITLARTQFQSANCMTDKVAALGALINKACPERDQSLQEFYEFAASDPLMLNKWFAIQAGSTAPDAIDKIVELSRHPDFTIRNPNRARALLATFAMMNSYRFHAKDGSGYKFLGDMVLQIDPLNPQLAARLISSFTLWKKYDEGRQRLMKEQLERIKTAPNLSKDTYEIVARSLA